MRAKLFITCLLVACSSSSSGDDTFEQGDGHEVIRGPVNGMSTQGSRLLGENPIDSGGPDPVYHVSATTHGRTRDGEPVEVRFFGSASLASGTHVGRDPFLDGIVLDIEGGGELKLGIHDGGSDVTRYTLRARATPNDEFVDPCHGHAAFPFAGRWTRAGLHEADPSHISFGCYGAVAYKCTYWGFPAGDDPTSLKWARHQACTRMARADYCSNGHTHTRDGTHITIYSRVGVGKPVPGQFKGLDHWPPDPGEATFEAAWNDGEKPASCLSRVRWQSLPLGGVCADNTVLPDPRESTTVKFCDDDDIASDGRPLLFNESVWTDLELYVWKNGNDLVSTVRGYYDVTGRSPDRLPFPNDGTYAFSYRDGMLLRSFIEGQDKTLYRQVRLFKKGNDHVIARFDDPPDGYTTTPVPPNGQPDPDFEGYVATKALTNKFVSFDLYIDSVTGDAVSSTIDPGGNYVKDTKHSPIGFIPRAETKDDTEPLPEPDPEPE